MASVLRQVEYYFSDHSWPFDEYLKSLATEEKDGFIDLSVIAGFGKMKAMVPDGDVATIAAALEASDSVQLSADKSGVKRLYPVPDVDPAAARTIHVAQFNTDESRSGIAALFGAFGVVENVRCLRNLAADDRVYDGSAFVVFADEAGAAAACAACAKGEVPGDAGPAGAKPLPQYYDEFMKKREGMRKKRGGEDGQGDGGGKKRQKAEAPPFDEGYTRGLVLKVSELANAGVDREAVKAALEPFGGVGWVEYQKDEADALVRFNDEGVAASVVAAAPLKITVGQPPSSADGSPKAAEGAEEASPASAETTVTTSTLAVLEGDEERGYWVRKHEDAAKRNTSRGGKGRKGGKGGKGRRGGKGGKGKGRR